MRVKYIGTSARNNDNYTCSNGYIRNNIITTFVYDFNVWLLLLLLLLLLILYHEQILYKTIDDKSLLKCTHT